MTNSCCISKNPPKPSLSIARSLPDATSRQAEVRTYIENKSDAGDLAAAMVYRPEASSERTAARAARVQSDVTKASNHLG